MQVKLEYGCIVSGMGRITLPDAVQEEVMKEYGHIKNTEVVIVRNNGAFAAAPKLKPLAELLESWDLYDTVDRAAPLVFQSVFRHFAEQVFVDEMGEDLLMAYLKEPYYWQEKLLAMYERNDSAWFDDVRTDEVEGRRELLLRAGRLALAELSADWGDNPANWCWGDAHTVTFAHPFIPGDRAANWIGGGTHAMAGSGETLNRAIWMWDKPYQTRIIDSIRIIVDMADDDKIEAHFPGGTSERWFDSWNKNFLPYWLSGEKAYWYFSDRAIEDNARYELLLKP